MQVKQPITLVDFEFADGGRRSGAQRPRGCEAETICQNSTWKSPVAIGKSKPRGQKSVVIFPLGMAKTMRNSRSKSSEDRAQGGEGIQKLWKFRWMEIRMLRPRTQKDGSCLPSETVDTKGWARQGPRPLAEENCQRDPPRHQDLTKLKG